jgi:hypothetical protein
MLLQALRKPAMVLASVLALSYLTYRIGFTLNLITPYATLGAKGITLPTCAAEPHGGCVRYNLQ